MTMGHTWIRLQTFSYIGQHLSLQQAELKKVEQALAKSSPLVFAGECRQLHEHLGKSRRGEAEANGQVIEGLISNSDWSCVFMVLAPC